MMIRFCPRCAGRPYTRAFDIMTCPTCGAPLEMENVTDSALSGRAELSAPRSAPPFGFGTPAGNEPFGGFGTNDPIGTFGTDGPFGAPPVTPTAPAEPAAPGGDLPWWGTPPRETPPAPQSPQPRQDPQPPQTRPAGGNVEVPQTRPRAASQNRGVESALGTTIHGRISQYSSTGKEDGNYRRLLVNRVADAIVYGQRFENVLHRFTVRVQGGMDAFGNQEYFDVPVNVHGTIAGGMQLADNNEVEVTGKYRNGVLMARKIAIVTNGYRTPVLFQRAVGLIALAVVALIAAVFAIYAMIDADNGGTVWANIVGFLKTWGTVSLILFVLYLLFSLTRVGFQLQILLGRRGSPLLVILVLALVLTVLFVGKFGPRASLLGTLAALGSALLPSVIAMVVVFYLVFRLIFK